MKQLHKTLALLLAVVMLSSTFMGALPVSAVDYSTTGPKADILFSTSFESNQAAPRTGTVEGSKLLGVGSAGTSVSLTNSYRAEVNQNSIAGSGDINSGESKPMLFDNNQDSKWLCNDGAPSAATPRWVSFSLNSSRVANAYMIQSANDANERDPMAWTVYGSNNGNTWTVLDSQKDIYFDARYQKMVFAFNNNTPYSYYKLEITKNRTGGNMTQIAAFEVGTLNTSSSSTGAKALDVSTGTGPSVTWTNNANDGWTGDRALTVTGSNILGGKVYCTNVLYDNLNIRVTDNTELDYVIFPSFYTENSDGYDFAFYNMHFMIDLAFSDGTYLSDLGAVDQNGIDMTPQAQAEGECLYTMQWNEVRTRIGEVAKGKTITKVLLNYACDNAESGKSFRAFFDDIVIKNEEPAVYTHLSDYVNILRGTNASGTFSRGLTIPAVTMPNGFNYYIPVTNTHSNAPYFYQLSASKNTMSHFEISHIASNWVGGWGSWQFMVNTSVPYNDANIGNLNSNQRAASFSHENEVAKAHYYSVTYNQGSKASGVKVEMTPTDHGVFARFTFPSNSANRNVIFDCDWTSGGVTLNNDGSFTGYSNHRQNGSVTEYIYGQFVDNNGNPISSQQHKIVNYTDGSKTSALGISSFSGGPNVVCLKLATSYISYEQAQRNLNLEIGSRDTFDDVYSRAQKTWDDLLGRVELEGGTEEQYITFYSCMYRMYMYPTNYSENTGTAENPHIVHASPYNGGAVTEGQMYTNNGFWDTYRTAWAGYALLTPNRDTELLNGLVQHYKDSGWIPRWLNPAGTNSMVGTSSDVIFGDAAARGIEFDMENAMKSAIKNATVVSSNLTNGGRKALETSNFLGYAPYESEAFSWSIEGYVNDYGISQLATAMGRYDDEADYFRNRSRYYVNLFNPNIGWFVGRYANGDFRTNSANFNPAGWGWGNDYTETNAWNMCVSVVQDGQGLANLYGGRQNLEKRLDDLFNDNIRNTQSGGIHEMKEAREVRMGEYHHSNQPSHHVIYMYNYAGAPAKTAERVREILTHGYAGQNIGQGYVGDEDNGEMSAWYVLSALGIYPVSMGSGEWAIGTPLFKKATVHMDNGNDLVINAPENSRENMYIQSAKLNGKDYDKNYFKHADLANGAVIDFTMGNKPSDWGTSEHSLPTSITKGDDVAQPATDVTKGMTVSANLSGQTSLAADGKQNAFDDNSNSPVTFNAGTTSIYYYNPAGKSISMYTITSGDNAGNMPTGYALYASNNNQSWVKLDERTNVTFQWAKYTKPFSVDESKRAVYKYYRLDVTGAGNVAEIELLGNNNVLSEGKTEYTGVWVNALIEALPDPGDVTVYEHSDAILEAQTAYNSLSSSEKSKVTSENVVKLNADVKALEDMKASYVDYEAENAMLIGDAKVYTRDGSDLSGGAGVENIGAAGGSLRFTVNADNAGERYIDIYYCTSADRGMDISVNGGSYTHIYATGNGADWFTGVKCVSVKVNLNKGTNTITITNTTDWAPQIDYIAIPDVSLNLRDDTLYGDVDMNGVVDANDLIALKQLILAKSWTEEQEHIGDLNKDGTLSVVDIMLIRQIIMGV